MDRSDVGSEQVGGDTAWVWIVVMLAVSKWGDTAWVWIVVMLAVSKWGDIAWVWTVV